MTTLTWPTEAAFKAASVRVGQSTSKSSYAGFFDGHVESLSHSAARLVFDVTFPPCLAADGAKREAFFLSLASSGDWVSLSHPTRKLPTGTMRGTPTVETAALAGARTLRVQSIVGATLVAGDPIGAGGQLLLAGYAGAVANGSGVLVVPLALPLTAPLSVSDAVTWQAPVTPFQLVTDVAAFEYNPGAWQSGLTITFRQVP